MNGELCPDCGAAQGKYHRLGCDVEQCPYCGGQLYVCGHEPPSDDRLAWDGCWPGERECIQNGWYVRFDKGQGHYIPCDAGDPGAIPDINKFRIEYKWHRKTKRWVKK
jgi:hypothetical protein